MRRKKTTKMMNNKGFSLVELIIVIAIMAILIGVLAPQFMKYVERSRKSTDVQSVASIVTALQVYASDPMVIGANQLNATNVASPNNEITLTTASVAVGTACNNTILAQALTDSGIDTVQLRSSDWGVTSVVLQVTVAANGTIGVTSNVTNGDIIAGTYTD